MQYRYAAQDFSRYGPRGRGVYLFKYVMFNICNLIPSDTPLIVFTVNGLLDLVKEYICDR